MRKLEISLKNRVFLYPYKKPICRFLVIKERDSIPCVTIIFKNNFLKRKLKIILIFARAATSAFLFGKTGKITVNAILGKINGSNGRDNDAEFVFSKGRSCSGNYCKDNRTVSKATILNLAGPSFRNRWRIKSLSKLAFGIEFS
jgi:hypothetical protein